MPYVVGIGSTAFRKWPERSFRSLTEEAVQQALEDAGGGVGDRIGEIHFGNCATQPMRDHNADPI